MSLPALRKPKGAELKKNIVYSKQDFIILTLKNFSKLVVSTDSFNCIITAGDRRKCILCNVYMGLENGDKDKHILSQEHQTLMKVFPYLEDLAENLVRQIDDTQCYCTICNVVTSTSFLMRHIKTDEHMHELDKARLRATTYKPNDLNNNK